MPKEPFMWKGYTWSLRESFVVVCTPEYKFAPVSLQLCKSQFDLSTEFNHQSFKHGLYKLWIDNNAFEC